MLEKRQSHETRMFGIVAHHPAPADKGVLDFVAKQRKRTPLAQALARKPKRISHHLPEKTSLEALYWNWSLSRHGIMFPFISPRFLVAHSFRMIPVLYEGAPHFHLPGGNAGHSCLPGRKSVWRV